LATRASQAEEIDMMVQAKDILPGDRINLSWVFGSMVVVSITPDPEFKSIVEIVTESDRWVGSATQEFDITRETNGQRLVRIAKAAGMFANDPEEF
jgi:hypothetical protein